jgi:hypothetical protein
MMALSAIFLHGNLSGVFIAPAWTYGGRPRRSVGANK